MDKEKVKTILEIIATLIMGYFLYLRLINVLNTDLIEKWLIAIIISGTSAGFIGFSIERGSKFEKLQIDFFIIGLYFLIDAISSLCYLSTNGISQKIFGWITVILFTGGITYLIILFFYAIYIVKKNLSTE